MNRPICIFLLDNVDSFTYNLVDELRGLGHELIVYRHHVEAKHIVEQMQQKALHNQVLLLLSPGPGAPADAGCMPELLALVQGQFAVLGICLGHQAIVEHYGGQVVRAGEVVHGKSSLISHDSPEIFADLPQPLPVARYHSLMAAELPASLEVIAAFDTVPMAVLHKDDRMLGFQFHPESILTAQGSELLSNSIAYLSRTTNHTKGQ